VAKTTVDTGLYAAKACNHDGIDEIGTKAFDKNVSGNSQAKPAVFAVSGFGMCRPIHDPIHETV
jgi:hypothetical protein